MLSTGAAARSALIPALSLAGVASASEAVGHVLLWPRNPTCDRARAGDLIWLTRGMYRTGRLTLTCKGTPDLSIVLRGVWYRNVRIKEVTGDDM